MFKFAAATAMVMALALPASAEIQPFPSSFQSKDIQTEGATLQVLVGGQGPAVVLLHGFGDTGAMHSAFAQFLSIPKDAEDNQKAIVTKLIMPVPVLAIGGAKSFGANEAVLMWNAATNVTELVIPAAGHWLMEEAPAATIAAIQAFID